jgi:hypothetical protein
MYNSHINLKIIMKAKTTPKISVLQEQMNALYGVEAGDALKTACTPWNLALAMTIKAGDPGYNILVIADAAILKAVIHQLNRLARSTAQVTFICTTLEQQAWAEKQFSNHPFKVIVIRMDYNDKTAWKGLRRMHKTHPHFDLVLGNPPYENGLWVDFLELAHSVCKPDGVIGMVSPTNWVYPYHKSHALVVENEPIWLHNDVRQTAFPDINESIGVFMFRKTPAKTHMMTMVGKDGVEYEYDSTKFMVPNSLDAEVKEIITKVLHDHESYEAHGRALPDKLRSEVQSEEFPYPTINHIWGTHYTSHKLTHAGKPKVLLSRMLKRTKGQRTMVAFADPEGKLQINDGYSLYPESADGVESLQWQISESKALRFISGYCDKSQYLSPALRCSIPKLPAYINSDAVLYAYCKLSQAAIDRIEATVQ